MLPGAVLDPLESNKASVYIQFLIGSTSTNLQIDDELGDVPFDFPFQTRGWIFFLSELTAGGAKLDPG